MKEWMTDNLGTIAAIVLLLAMVYGAVVVIWKDKKKGKSSCGCNCAHCAMAGSCHKTK